MNFFKKRTEIIIFLVIVIIPIIVLLIDLADISSLIPFTFEFDWLAFFGGYLSFSATLLLAMVSIKQNDRLNEVNDKIIESNAIINCYSKIMMSKQHFLQMKDNYFSADYGNIMKNEKYTIIGEKDNYFRFIFEIKDVKGIPLKSAKINQIILQSNITIQNGGYCIDTENEFKYEYFDHEEVILEKNDDGDDVYYLPAILIDDIKNIEGLFNSQILRVTVNFSIRNIFNVVNISEHTILITKSSSGGNLGHKYVKSNSKSYYIDSFFESRE